MALEKFCFCCKLQNGTVISGVLSIVLDVIAFIITISLLDDATPLFSTIIAISTIHLIFSILLIIGVLQENHWIMLPWIVFVGLLMIPFAIAACLSLFVVAPIYGPIYIWWCVCSTYQKVQQETRSNFILLSQTSHDTSIPLPNC